MTPVPQRMSVSAPGRICLFGEHQDYLGLPVIASAISLRLTVTGARRSDNIVQIRLPDINGNISFPLHPEIPYVRPRDYFPATANLLQREGYTFSKGFDITVKGNIPINSGTSSSSALVVAWSRFLLEMSDQRPKLSPEQIGELAYRSEVEEFREAGGRMDQYTLAIGGTLFIRFTPDICVERLPAQLGTFVLGDSGEPKDTQAILSRVKDRVLDIASHLRKMDPTFSLHFLSEEKVKQISSCLNAEEAALLEGTVRNHHITQHAKTLLSQPNPDGQDVGCLLNDHQQILRDVLRISTPKIDRMIDAALNAGAFGGKINGSGGGGCMFAYAPDNPQAVADAIASAGGKATIVTVDRGVDVA